MANLRGEVTSRRIWRIPLPAQRQSETRRRVRAWADPLCGTFVRLHNLPSTKYVDVLVNGVGNKRSEQGKYRNVKRQPCDILEHVRSSSIEEFMTDHKCKSRTREKVTGLEIDISSLVCASWR